MPQRIQRRRTKGWKMPETAIYVGRTSRLEGQGWANPFRIGGYFMLGDPDQRRGGLRMAWCQTFLDPPEPGFTRIVDRQMAVNWYRAYTETWSPVALEWCRKELGGHDLCCWCPLDQPCHADVLLELANR